MKKEFYNSEELDLKSNLNSELSTRIFSPNYSLSELAENDESNILMEDEENIGCLLESRPEDDIIDFFGNKIIDDHWSKYKIEVSVSVDISLYPLKENFIAPIDDFIASLQKYENIEVRTNSSSTQLFG